MRQPLQLSLEDASEIEQTFVSYEPLQVRYNPAELIYQRGGFVAGMHLVISGIAKEEHPDRGHGQPPIAVGLLGPGSLLDVEVLHSRGEELHQTSCRALTAVTLLFLERSAFFRAVTESRFLRCALDQHVAERRLGLLQLLRRSQLPDEVRLQDTLLDLLRFGEPASGGLVALPPEFDLHLVAHLAYLPSRKIRDLLNRSPGGRIEDGGRLLLNPEALRPDDGPSQRIDEG
jgi:CRP-like cAMP-binding protein